MEAIRCTLPSCQCECFSPGKAFTRICDSCKHGWVAHALDKLGYRSMYQLGMQVEIAQPNIVFDIASLILYGTQATPIRLKILLDRLFSVLQHDEVLQVLHGFGWTYEDYARGYILQTRATSSSSKDSNGHVLDKWNVATREEEQIILQQFLRFGETKSIAQEIILQDSRENREKSSCSSSLSPKPAESEIKKFLERSNVGMQSFMRGYDQRPMLAARQITFAQEKLAAAGSRLLSPSAIPRYQPPPVPTREGPTGMLLPISTSTPLAGSPLTRLQTMQPFDYRRERLSPTLSPTSERSIASSAERPRSPQNLSMSALTPSSTSAASPAHHHALLHTPIKSECSMEEKSTPTSMASSSMESSDTKDDYEEVINYSTKDNPPSAHAPLNINCNTPLLTPSPMRHPITRSSVYADQKVRHIRKSNNPMKRPWQPTPGYGGTLISPSGKKRVLCTACNKTFCDKGALKIHYSAVHLKEMHKCTVEGCNMMFSSRRSRNRHSANPNPKLHTPQARRKLPEGSCIFDEKSMSPLPHVIAPMPCMISSTSPLPQSETLPMVSSSPSLHGMVSNSPSLHGISKKLFATKDGIITTIATAAESAAAAAVMATAMIPAPTEPIYYIDPHGQASRVIEPSPLKIPRLEPKDGMMSRDDRGLAMEIKQESTSRSSSRRKKHVPTRVAAQMEDVYPLSDDNSNDGMAIVVEPEHGTKFSALTGEGDGDLDGEYFGSDGSPLSPSISEADGSSSSHTHDGDMMGLKGMCVDGCAPDDDDDDGMSHDDDDEPMALDCSVRSMRSKEGDVADSTMEGDELDDDKLDEDVPLDRENPRRCPACGKNFPNHFTVKTHYQNVHLKLMHICTVDGCNAAFPSKRSRDRHSSNLNLHRKLLSTTSSDCDTVGTRSIIGQSLRDEFLPRIYEAQKFPAVGFAPQPFMRMDVAANGLEGPSSTTNGNAASPRSVSPATGGTGEALTNHVMTSAQSHNKPMTNGDDSDQEVSDHSTMSTNNNTESESGNMDEHGMMDTDGNVSCHLCDQTFRDNLVLKEHFEKIHPKEMFHCTIQGCDKIFSTRKSRNRHSQNDNLHRHIAVTLTNGTA